MVHQIKINESEEAKKDEHKEYTKKIKSEPSKIFNLNNYRYHSREF